MSSTHPDWNAVLGHELRTPVAAILGYQELLEDGTLGPIPAAAAEALRRVRFAASQLITLIDAVEGSADGQKPSAFPVRDLFDDAISAVRADCRPVRRAGRGRRSPGGSDRHFTRRTLPLFYRGLLGGGD